MSEAAIDLEAERRASLERRNAQLRPSRARLVREKAADHESLEEAADALFKHLGEEEVARIAALAASDDPLDDGTRRYAPEEIEAYMATRAKRLSPDDARRVHEYVAAARANDPAAKPRQVWRRVKQDLGIDLKLDNFYVTYWYQTKRRRREKAAKPTAPPPPAPRETSAAPASTETAEEREPTPRVTRTRRRSYADAIQMLRNELTETMMRVERLRDAIQALEMIEAKNGGTR